MPTMILKNGPTGHLWEPHDRWNNTSKLWPIRIPMYSSTMYDFHNSTDNFVNPSFLPFCTPKRRPELALKTGILVPKVAYDLPEFKIRPGDRSDHIAIIMHN